MILEEYVFMMKMATMMMMRKRGGVGLQLCLLAERDVCQSHGCLLQALPTYRCHDDDDDDGDHHDVVPHLIPKSLIKELEIGSSLGVSEKSI